MSEVLVPVPVEFDANVRRFLARVAAPPSPPPWAGEPLERFLRAADPATRSLLVEVAQATVLGDEHTVDHLAAVFAAAPAAVVSMVEEADHELAGGGPQRFVTVDDGYLVMNRQVARAVLAAHRADWAGPMRRIRPRR